MGRQGGARLEWEKHQGTQDCASQLVLELREIHSLNPYLSPHRIFGNKGGLHAVLLLMKLQLGGDCQVRTHHKSRMRTE